MREEIINIKNEGISQIMETSSLSELERLRLAYLGRNGKLTKLIKKIKNLNSEEKKQIGLLINETKSTLQNLISSQKNKLKQTSRQWFDPTIPGNRPAQGHLHLISQAIEEISNVFEKIGFVRVRYPEVEWDWFTFGSLNFGKWHPARDEWETFILDTPEHPKYGPMLLTPHTTSGDIREMRRVSSLPIRMINIAKCYRRQLDVSHFPMFHQFDGLVIDKDISIVHLKGTLDYFARNFFGPKRKTRLRPYNFPFTEPSFEVDVSCDICQGKGRLANGQACKLCREGWLELGGAGMVHPAVLKNGGVDPKKYTGFAFGWGVERTYMMRSGLKIPDIRLLYSSNLKFLKQF